MDVNDEYITMLTPDGEFVKAKATKASYDIGEEVPFFPLNERVRSNTSNKPFFQVKKWRYALASSVVAILLLSLFIPFSQSDEVYAYMSIDINPSFEVGLDEELRVISLEALNEEAKKLLESIPNWKNNTLDSIADKIILKSRDNGYLEEGKQVLITTVVTDTHDIEVDQSLQKGINEIKEEYEKEQIAVTSVTSTAETRKAAKDKGISTGKLLIQENKLPKPVQEKKTQPVKSEKKEIQNTQPGNSNQQEVIEEFKETRKQNAEHVREELKEKKEQVKEKVKQNIDNSNMPAHVKEKVQNKMEENWQKKERKREEKDRKKEEKGHQKDHKNRGYDDDDDDDEDDDDDDRDDDDD